MTIQLVTRFKTGLLLVLSLLLMETGNIFCAAEKSQPISNLERALFQTAYPNQPDALRLQRLETTLGLPSSGSTALRLNRIYQRQQKSLQASPVPTAVTAYNQGIEASARGQLQVAQKSYESALKADPAFVPAYNNLADVLMQSGETEKAVTLYQRALQLAPADAALYRNLAVGFERSGRVPEAMRAYENYLAMAPAPDPTIAHLVSEYKQSLAETQLRNDYADRAVEASSGRLLLWPKQPSPVMVVIESQAGDGDLFLPTVREALAAWEAATGKRIRFRESASSLLPSRKTFNGIWITLQSGPLAHPFLDVGHAHFESHVLSDDTANDWGSTVHNFRPKAASGPERVWITLNVGHAGEPLPMRIRQVKRLALHELGHAVGIWGHSANPQDIMYTHPVVDALSTRDIQTINTLYAQQQASVQRQHNWQSFDAAQPY